MTDQRTPYDILYDLRVAQKALAKEESKEVYGEDFERISSRVELLEIEADNLIEERLEAERFSIFRRKCAPPDDTPY